MCDVPAGGVDGFRSLLQALQAIEAKATKAKKHLEYSLGKVKVRSSRGPFLPRCLGTRSHASAAGQLAALARTPIAGPRAAAWCPVADQPLSHASRALVAQILNDRATRQSGAAFDLPLDEAQALVGNPAILAAAAKMGYVLDQPKALPLDLSDMLATGERGGRFGR